MSYICWILNLFQENSANCIFDTSDVFGTPPNDSLFFGIHLLQGMDVVKTRLHSLSLGTKPAKLRIQVLNALGGALVKMNVNPNTSIIYSGTNVHPDA